MNKVGVVVVVYTHANHNLWCLFYGNRSSKRPECGLREKEEEYHQVFTILLRCGLLLLASQNDASAMQFPCKLPQAIALPPLAFYSFWSVLGFSQGTAPCSILRASFVVCSCGPRCTCASATRVVLFFRLCSRRTCCPCSAPRVNSSLVRISIIFCLRWCTNFHDR